MDQFGKIRHLLHQAIWVYLRPYWKLHFLLGLAILVTVGFEVGLPLTIRFLIDAALIPHDSVKLILALVSLVLLFGLAALARYGLAIIKAYMNAELYRDLYSLLIQLMQRLPMRYFDEAQPGHFSPLFDTELLTLSRTFRDLLANGVQAMLQLLVIVVTLFFMNWPLALAVLLMLPLIVWRPQRKLKPTVDAIDQIRKVVEKHNSAVTDFVSSQTLVRAFGRLDHSTRKLVEDSGRKGSRGTLRHIGDIKKLLRSPHFLMQAFKLSMDSYQAMITLLVIGAGAWLSFAGLLTLGTFSAFILLLPAIMQAVSKLADYAQELGRATLSLDRFERIMKAASPELSADSQHALRNPTESIEFQHVNFSYASNTPQLRDVTLTLPIGQSMALVGRSGSGKSTLFKLLLGLYPPDSGRILVDGHDLSHTSPASRVAHIGTVLQQSVLLNTTIRNNICFAKPDATDEDIVQAARSAEIHDYIVTLPNGYETGVGEGGKWLSEGQKQRVALARALLPNPSILLLDEVTASLDPESESMVNATIQRLATERTVILVTHRLASVLFVDQLAVIDQGEIKELGRHGDLLERQGLYHRMWQMQSGFVVSGDGHHAAVQGTRLQAIPLFRDVAINALDMLAEQFVSEFYQPRDSVYQEGAPGDKFFILVRGTVRLSSTDASGKSIHLADLQDGDCFGEGEMLSHGRRASTVKTMTPCLVLALHAHHFHALMNKLGSLRKVVTQMALGRSLSTICSVGRRRRSHPIWQAVIAPGNADLVLRALEGSDAKPRRVIKT